MKFAYAKLWWQVLQQARAVRGEIRWRKKAPLYRSSRMTEGLYGQSSKPGRKVLWFLLPVGGYLGQCVGANRAGCFCPCLIGSLFTPSIFFANDRRGLDINVLSVLGGKIREHLSKSSCHGSPSLFYPSAVGFVRQLA